MGGKVYVGACDNASGVAAVLEMARGMVKEGKRPRRSVCFLITDAEEFGLLGAQAFVIRPDFSSRRVVANVNIDMLGRELFDLYEDTLVVAGTERFVEVRREADGTAAAEGLRLYPVGDDLLGARDDHAVFAAVGVPAFFFTCGLYRDYHGVGDVAGKIDYGLLDRQARVAARVVGFLADADRPVVKVEPQMGDRGELALVVQTLRVMVKYGGVMGLPAEIRGKLPGLMDRGEELLRSRRYSLEDREAFLTSVAAVAPPGYLASPTTLWGTMIECSLEGVRHLSRHPTTRPGEFPAFRKTLHRTADRLIRVGEIGDGRVRLSAYMTFGSVEMDASDKGLMVRAGMRESLAKREGTRREVEQYCLDEWARELKEPSWGECWRRVLVRVAGEDVGDYGAWRKRVGPSTRPSTRVSG
jgi:hypothetical protein